MRNRIIHKLAAGIALLSPLAIANAQQLPSAAGAAVNAPAPAAATAPTAVPALVPYSGAAVDGRGKPLAGEASATFLVYKDQQGGEPLFAESQTISFDDAGRYKVQLGASSPNGLPSDLFASGEARWLEVQIAGQPVEPRVLLASVPYALKAADAATLGGLPASAYALAAQVAKAAVSPAATPGATNVTTTGGTAGYLAEFSGASTIVDSPLFVLGADVGVGTATPTATLDVNGTALVTGALTVDGGMSVTGSSTYNGPFALPAQGTATASADFASQVIKVNTSAYNSATKAAVSPRFELQAFVTGQNTANPGATLDVLASTTSAGAVPTGFSINTSGIVTFAPGQTFPGSGSGTITGITAGAGLTGGGTSGSVSLAVDPTKVAQLATANTFSAPITVSFPSGIGLTGLSTSGMGVQGVSTNGTGVQGVSASSYGVEGTSNSGPGVLGYTVGSTSNTAGTIGQAGATSGYGGIAGVWGDSSAHVGVYGTSSQAAGVFGLSSSGVGVQGSSTTQNGVYGFSSKTSGVHGETQSTSTGDAAVYGGSDSVATGVIGVSANGAGVQGVSTNSWAGRFSNSSASATVYATNAASSGGSALFGVASGTYGIGLYANATASNGTGVLAYGDGNAVNGNSNGDVLGTAGVLGVAGYRTGVGGIAGVWGDAAEHVGVIGSSTDYSGVYGASTNSFGMQAFSANSAGVYGVGGSSLNPVYGAPVGVWGDVTGCCAQQIPVAVLGNASVGVGGRFTNNSSLSTVDIFNYGNGGGIDQNAIFRTLQASTPTGTCGFGGNGDMTCTGQVKALATTANGSRTVETYSMQSPENWMEDFGSGTLKNGATTVALDPAFAETVSAEADYHVFLTPRGDSKGLFVTNATGAGFEVRESGGGTSSISFDYRIVAKRRGFEAQRMVDVTEAMKAVQAKNELQTQHLKKAAE